MCVWGGGCVVVHAVCVDVCVVFMCVCVVYVSVFVYEHVWMGE